MRRVRRIAAALGLAVCACSYRPARFANRLPVTEVHDDRPIPVPARVTFIEDLYQADVYVRRELTNGLDPRRTPEALDVSSIDEVPSSSWYRGAPNGNGRLLEGYEQDGPPRPPFELSNDAPASETPGATVITDARGLRYELLHDPEGREGMRTAAAAIASRLVYALGYRTPEVHVITSHEGRRAAATRWPPGIDLGPTPIASTRPDDPNDFLPHLERRTLRALFHVTAWIDMHRMRPRNLRDVYVGKPGRGHVQHYLLGLDGALGADNFDEAVAWANDPDRQESNFFLRMFSLGLSPKPPGFLPETQFTSVGLFTEVLLPDKWDMSPPFEPTDRLLAGDAYWIAKRIAAVDARTIAQALDAAKLEEDARKWIGERVAKRRTALIAHGYEQTTPCEVSILAEATDKTPAQLRLLDRAVFQGFVPTSQRSYRVRILDDAGERVVPDRGVAATGAVLSLELPPELLDTPYFVVQVRASFGDRKAPQPVEIHIRSIEKQFRLVGVRH